MSQPRKPLRLRYGLGLLLAIACLAALPLAGPLPSRGTNPAPQTQEAEVRVWVNLASRVYHCPGTRWYGKSKQGKYLGECAARKAGYRPAYKKPCGSTCP